jgi:hypothetical protein
MAKLSPYPRLQFFDTNGDPLAFGKIWTYEAGSVSVLLPTYTSEAATVQQSQPISLDAGGFVPDGGLWLGDQSYKLVCTTSDDTVVWTVDNIQGVNGGSAMTSVDSIAELRLLTAGLTPVVYVTGYYTRGDKGGGIFTWQTVNSDPDNAGTLIKPSTNPPVGRWLRAQDQTNVNPRWFGAYGDNSVDDAAAISAADTYCQAYSPAFTMTFDYGVYWTTFFPISRCKLQVGAKLYIDTSGSSGYGHPVMKIDIDDNDTTQHFDCTVDNVPAFYGATMIRPEWFPNASIDFAIAAIYRRTDPIYDLSPESTVIELQANRYAPLSAVITADNVVINGQSRPVYAMGPTRLAVGTVIEGPVVFTGEGCQIKNLGIDSGAWVCQQRYSGVQQDGLRIRTNNCTAIEKQGVAIENVIVLCSDYDSSVIACSVENATGFSIKNLTTIEGSIGLQLRSSYGSVDGSYHISHKTAGVVLSNYDTVVIGYGLCHDVTLNNIRVHGYTNTTGGILFDNTQSTMNYLERITVTGYECFETAYGVKLAGTASKTCRNIAVWPAVADAYATARFVSADSSNWDKATCLLGSKNLAGANNFLAPITGFLGQDQIGLKTYLTIYDSTSVDGLGNLRGSFDPLAYRTVGTVRQDATYGALLDLTNIGSLTAKSITIDSLIIGAQGTGSWQFLSTALGTVKKYDGTSTNYLSVAWYPQIGASGDRIATGTLHSAVVAYSVVGNTCNLSAQLYLSNSQNDVGSISLRFYGTLAYLNPTWQTVIDHCFGPHEQVGYTASNGSGATTWGSAVLRQVGNGIVGRWISIVNATTGVSGTITSSAGVWQINMCYQIGSLI